MSEVKMSGVGSCLPEAGEEEITAEMIAEVQNLSAGFDFNRVRPARVEAALNKERLRPEDLGALLSPAAGGYLEEMARQVKNRSLKFFGRNIGLYTPLYIANFCVNECAYCGYNRANDIKRARLSFEEIEAEARAIAATGLTDILLLTGESRAQSGVEYIGRAVEILARHFKSVGLEVYPLKTGEYRYLHQLGADFVSVYQETYDPEVYAAVHLAGPKKNYAWRFGAQTRALTGGFRGAAFGALLGLADFRRDALACGFHAYLVAKKFPAAEISFSAPRLRPFPNQPKSWGEVGERELTQVILALKLFMPWAGLSLSTRESAWYRDRLMGLGVTRLSAGVKTTVGGHSGGDKGDAQFHKSDERNVEEMRRAISDNGFQPVFNDYVRL